MKGIHVIYEANGTAFRANLMTELYTSNHIRTSAIAGTLNIVHATLEQVYKLYHLPLKETIFAWDKGHSPRRKELYPEYKHNRKKEWTPEDELWKKEFYQQTDILHDNLHLLGIKSYRKLHWEGDDLIWGFVHLLTKKYPHDIIVIISTDEDFHQLIDSQVHVYSPIKKLLYTPENYRELMGMDVENFLAYKLLKGDSSDGIPGIAGIGDKTAKTIVNTYGGIEGILSSSKELKKSRRTAAIFTREGLMILDRNNKLINLKECVDLSPVLDDLQKIVDERPSIDNKAVKEFFMKYQLTSLIVKYREWSVIFDDMVKNFGE